MMTAGPFGGPMDGPRGPMNSNEMPLGPRGSMSNNDGPMGGPRMLGNGPMNANDVPMGGPRMPGNDVGMGRPPPSRDNQNNQQRNFGSNNFSSNGVPPPANPDQPQNTGRPIDLRIILSRDEVAFLFGFDGNLINQLRQQTGAHIQITDGESFEYVLLISGAVDIIFKAFSLVCRKLWDLLTKIAGPGHNRPLKIRIAVPAVQCGSIIGKAGAKVKEIRDLTGAQIQVSHEPLPNSTERCVEISGSGESCLQCTYHICCVMQEAPLRGEVIPYIPPVNGGPQGGPGPQHGGPPMGMPPAGPGGIDSWRPVFLCGDKAFIIDGPIARPAPPELLRRELAKTPLGGDVAESLANNTMSSNMPDHMNPLALMAAISKSQQNGGQNQQPQTSREMTVNSEMINIMMAQSQGQKIDEIRRMSGAQIHISDQQGGPGSNPGDRLITLSGSEESILLAQFLIQANVDTIIKERREAKSQFPPPTGPAGGPGGPPPGPGHPMGGRGGSIPMQQGPPPQMHQNHQNSLHPTNQFDPSIMQQNFQDEKPNNFQGGHPGGPPGHQGGSGGNPHLQPPPFQQQDQGGFNRNQGGPPPGGHFRNNSGDGPGRFQGGPHGMGGPGSNPGRGGRGDRRSPMGDRGDNRRGGRRGRR